jgi:NADH-quinone oxidoreductase subunit J
MNLDTIGFWGISAVLIAMSLLIIESKKVVHYILFLFIFVLAVTSMFLLLNAVFLSVAELVIYNGGIVLILAVSIMLMPESTITPSSRKYIFLVPVAVLAFLVFLIFNIGPGVVSGANYSDFAVFFITTYGPVLVVLAITAVTAIITTVYFVNRGEL